MLINSPVSTSSDLLGLPPSFIYLLIPLGPGTPGQCTCLSRTHEILLSCYLQAKNWQSFKDTGSHYLYPEGESVKGERRDLSLVNAFTLIFHFWVSKKPEPVRGRGSPKTYPPHFLVPSSSKDPKATSTPNRLDALISIY